MYVMNVCVENIMKTRLVAVNKNEMKCKRFSAVLMLDKDKNTTDLSLAPKAHLFSDSSKITL
jgi:hypothetical protein